MFSLSVIMSNGSLPSTKKSLAQNDECCLRITKVAWFLVMLYLDELLEECFNSSGLLANQEMRHGVLYSNSFSEFLEQIVKKTSKQNNPFVQLYSMTPMAGSFGVQVN